MKKISIILGTLSFFMMISCNVNSDDYNNDKDGFYVVPPETLLTNAQKVLIDEMTTPSVNTNPFRLFSQYWAQTTYNDESRYRLTSRDVAGTHWNTLYRNVLGNLKTAEDIVKGDAVSVKQKNKIAIIEILQVYTFQLLVDTYGNIPYDEALNPLVKLPKYDDGATIYTKLIARLNAAIGNLNTSDGSFDTGEYIYNGDVSSWKLFGNSLKVKLGLNLADINPTLSKTTVESGFAGGVILTNAQNATFNYPSSAPNYSALYGELIASNRTDFVASVTLTNKMNALVDPRLSAYFESVSGTYVGGIYGAANTNTFSFSQIGVQLKKPDFPGVLFEASEINFYLAEAAARSYSVGGTAAFYYKTAIESSFDYWKLTPAQATSYLANPQVAYLTATGTYKEKIGTQAWIALYNRSFESWTSYRRLDFPVLLAPSNASSAANGVVPKRLTYPIGEQTVNAANYQSAVAAIGGLDKLKVKLFWDTL